MNKEWESEFKNLNNLGIGFYQRREELKKEIIKQINNLKPSYNNYAFLVHKVFGFDEYSRRVPSENPEYSNLYGILRYGLNLGKYHSINDTAFNISEDFEKKNNKKPTPEDLAETMLNYDYIYETKDHLVLMIAIPKELEISNGKTIAFLQSDKDPNTKDKHKSIIYPFDLVKKSSLDCSFVLGAIESYRPVYGNIKKEEFEQQEMPYTLILNKDCMGNANDIRSKYEAEAFIKNQIQINNEYVEKLAKKCGIAPNELTNKKIFEECIKSSSEALNHTTGGFYDDFDFD